MKGFYAMRKWITQDELLTNLPCELIYAMCISDGGKIQDTWLYNGEDTLGEPIINLQSGISENIELSPPEPIKCNRGIYVVVGSNTEGVLVMWRNSPKD